jgi:exosortase family protein XrtF
LKNNYLAYRPFLLFLGKFFLTYLILFFLYQFYLHSFDSSLNEVDGFTKWVAQTSSDVLVFFGYTAHVVHTVQSPCYNFYIDITFVSRIVEGCNGLSVIILFASFIVAFSTKLKPTFMYILSGSLLIGVLNILRVAIINLLLYYYPEYQTFLHDIFFPAIIYGVVFILWMIWVNKHSNYAN